MKKTDDLLKNAQDLEFRRAELMRAGIIRVTPERDVPAEDQEPAEAAALPCLHHVYASSAWCDRAPSTTTAWSEPSTKEPESAPEDSCPELRAEVEQFCIRHGLVHYLSLALELAQKHFDMARAPEVEREQDSETGEEWITLDVVVRATPEEFFNHYDRYTDALVATIPWPERDKIRLSYRLA